MMQLRIRSEAISPDQSNYTLPCWPPSAHFPVVIDTSGKVVSRFSDPVWDLSPWVLKPMRLYFGDKPVPGRRAFSLTPPNADLLRKVAAWWLWGPQAVTSLTTLKTRFGIISALFSLCTQEGIPADKLYRFPKVADKLPTALSPSVGDSMLTLLHDLYEHRDELGFTLLDREALRRFSSALPRHTEHQTAYIPPRIWLYQVSRLREFLTDFSEHKERIEACFRYCLDAYAEYYGSSERAFLPAESRRRRSPFSGTSRGGDTSTERFSAIAERYGISDQLFKWIVDPTESIDVAGRSVVTLSSYLTLAGRVGIAYLLNFSMMRVEEAWNLRTDCFRREDDPRFGTFYSVAGRTTKTLDDDGARWITAPSTELAIEVLSFVAKLRMVSAATDPDVPKDERYFSNPHLVVRSYEPWANAKNSSAILNVRPQYPSYQDVIRSYPKLFDPQELKIKGGDLVAARAVTPRLEPSRYRVGKAWPLSWHQLRRTGAVNMFASGMVSDASIQYQLKHASRAMSLYYGHGYSSANFDSKARSEYIRTMYEVLSRDIDTLFTERFVSPYGRDRKAAILNAVGARDAKALLRAATSGSVSWRETLLGGCTRRGPCPYGGIDNVVRCAGGDGRGACADALFDIEKGPRIENLRQTLSIRLAETVPASPDHDSIAAQIRAIDNALNVLSTREPR